MKKIFLVIISGLVLLCVISFNINSNPKGAVSLIKRNPDIANARLVYRVSLFGILPVAEAVFEPVRTEQYGEGKTYHLSATAKNLSVYSMFISTEARLDSYIDIQMSSPMLFKQKISTKGKADAGKEVYYNQAEGVMTMAGIKRNIPFNTQDPLSAVFNIRRMDFAKVKEFEMNINSNQKNYTLKADTRLKNGLVFLDAQIFRKDKNPYHRSNISMVLCGKENIPALIKVFASGVLINVKLIKIQ